MSGVRVVGGALDDVGRNDPCPCGSGRKFKHCCLAKQGQAAHKATPDLSLGGLEQRLQALALAARQLWDADRQSESIAAFLEIARLAPNSAPAHHDLGIAYLRSGRYAEAAASLQRAIELDPGSGRSLPALAYALEVDGREGDALSVSRIASRAADSPDVRQHFVANTLVMEGRLEEAEQELRSLLVRTPEREGSRRLLARALAERGRFEEAAEQLTQAIELAPREPFAFAELASVKRMTEADRPLIERVREFAERPGLDMSVRINMHFGLGKAFDDLDDRAEAIQHYEAGNRLRAAAVRLNRAGLVKQYDNLISRFTPQAFEQAARLLARPIGPGDDMPVFIVGMPRSGTTLVEQVLSSHPAVGAGGELRFWKDCLSNWQAAGVSVKTASVAQAAEQYRALLARLAPGALRVTDKAPDNFERIWLIRLALPDARIIHCRRNPVDTCLSIYFTNFNAGLDYAYDRGDLVFYYRQYERLMEHSRRMMPPDRFTEVEYEALVADREAETRRLVAFCGLDWDDACLTPERNTRLINTASRWQARQPVYTTSVQRWRRYEPWLGELRELLPAASQSSTTALASAGNPAGGHEWPIRDAPGQAPSTMTTRT